MFQMQLEKKKIIHNLDVEASNFNAEDISIRMREKIVGLLEENKDVNENTKKECLKEESLAFQGNQEYPLGKGEETCAKNDETCGEKEKEKEKGSFEKKKRAI